MGKDNGWHPDEKFLRCVERYVIKSGEIDDIDVPSENMMDKTVRDVLRMLDGDKSDNEVVRYLKENFKDLDAKASDGPITVREQIEHMRKGDTVLGVLEYLLQYSLGVVQDSPGFYDNGEKHSDRVIRFGMERMFKDYGIRDVQTREEIPNATFDLTFTNPATPFNRNNWFGVSYDSDEKEIKIIGHGEISELDEDLVKSISENIPDSEYSHPTIDFYKWKLKN